LEDIAHVGFDGVLGEIQRGRDLAVRLPRCDQGQDPALVARERRERIGWIVVAVPTHLGEDHLGDGWIEEGSAVCDLVHGFDQPRWLDLLEQVTRGACEDRIQHRVFI
jgi:hypothetical protein